MVPPAFRDDPDVIRLEAVLSALGLEADVGFDRNCGWWAGARRSGNGGLEDWGTVYFRSLPRGFWRSSWSGESIGAAARHFISSVGAGGVLASYGRREAEVPRFSDLDELRMKVAMSGGFQWRALTRRRSSRLSGSQEASTQSPSSASSSGGEAACSLRIPSPGQPPSVGNVRHGQPSAPSSSSRATSQPSPRWRSSS